MPFTGNIVIDLIMIGSKISYHCWYAYRGVIIFARYPRHNEACYRSPGICLLNQTGCCASHGDFRCRYALTRKSIDNTEQMDEAIGQG